ncbi:aromatic-ring hydroxylase C-terminal domain-containing protein [Streptomyces europaeiscabiei]|uniref:aromatic-ring hydroxylase C-terminal domain-containing protein n=1 Tax=Streptomyces europaeiscabiei TaxID=146819 RepID=UPI0038F62766
MRWARRSASLGPRSSAARASSSDTGTAAPRSAYRTAVRNRPTSRTSTYRRHGPAAARRTSGCPTAARCSTTSGAGFTLVVSGSADPMSQVEAARGCGVPLTVLRLADPAAAELYERPLVLVRPDGHVGWRGRRAPADPVVVLDILRGATVPPLDAKAPGAAWTVPAGVGTHLV